MNKPVFKKSNVRGKKYSVEVFDPKTSNNKLINFGDSNMAQYHDSTGLNLYSYKNHEDKKRRESYLKRAKGIRDKNGNLTYLNPNSANYYSINYLW